MTPLHGRAAQGSERVATLKVSLRDGVHLTVAENGRELDSDIAHIANGLGATVALVDEMAQRHRFDVLRIDAGPVGFVALADQFVRRGYVVECVA